MSRRPLVAGPDFLKDVLAVSTPESHEQNMNRNEKTSTHTNTKHTIEKKSMNDKSTRRRGRRRWHIIRLSRRRSMQDIKTVWIMTNTSNASRA